MFEIVSEMIIDLAKFIPYVVPVILVINICSYLLWGDNR